ncbi:MAG: tyrosine-type recombinase/integrase [Planctomycetaceae bacterium]|nr:tyrosine-type recombinase/integrase [Planctomycetaceae bacterium]
MLPPYATNPFSSFPIDGLRDPREEDEGQAIFSPEQERAFFTECDDWQRRIFQTLATYGLRVGELTHLLIEDVDLIAGTIQIRSKPELNWRVKTARRRQLPLTTTMKEVFGRLIGSRSAGFVFLDRPFAAGEKALAQRFDSGQAFRRHLEQLAAEFRANHPEATAAEERRAITRFSRSMGQVTVKQVRLEFCRITRAIGCPQFTRTHDLRHLFSSRAQEQGVNPLLVQEILGHTTLAMTKRYTHLGLETKRDAIEKTNAKEVQHGHAKDSGEAGTECRTEACAPPEGGAACRQGDEQSTT